MSSSGRPLRHTMPTPSPVSVWALEVVLKILPNPPVAKTTALDWNTCRSPVASSYATTPETLVAPSASFTVSRSST